MNLFDDVADGQQAAPEPNDPSKRHADHISHEIGRLGLPTHVVAKGRIRPPTDDRERADYEKYSALSRGVRLAQISLAQVREGRAMLLSEFPWFEPLIDRVFSDMEFKSTNGNGVIRLDPLLLVGEPGIGKTRFCRRLGEALNINTAFYSVAGSNDNQCLQGTARGWATAHPSLPINVLLDSNIGNPLIVIDELDKSASSRRNGNVLDTLLQFTERESSARFFDECLDTNCDISPVNWLFTANDSTAIPTVLRSRLKIVRVGQPGPADFDSILNTLVSDFTRQLQVDKRFFQLDEYEKQILREAFDHGSIRVLVRLVGKFLQRKDRFLMTVAH